MTSRPFCFVLASMLATILVSQPGCLPSKPTGVPRIGNSSTPDDPGSGNNATASSIEERSFGKTEAGQETTLFTCTNKNGLVLKMTDYGATIVALETPNRDGDKFNIVLGFDSVAGYEKHSAYFGSTVGRYANRIAKGKFKIGETEYTLVTNNDENHLHGGKNGFNRVVWKAEKVETGDASGIKFFYRSANEEEGYPGNLDVTVIYTLNNDDELTIEYTATADKPTVLNLTNLAYWNLDGAGSGDILAHELTLTADKYLAVDAGLIPTGEMADVKGTPLDFTSPHTIGSRIREIQSDPVGYDHCFVLRGQEGKLELAATVKDSSSGRSMEILTTQPGIQLYTGNFLDGDAKNGGHRQYAAFCLETQHYPDSPNRPEFPSTLLEPGETFRSKTVHKFSAD